MRVLVAKHMGFCGGVRRAVDMALKAARNGPGGAATWGPLIHNPQEVARLEREGVRVAQSPEDLGGGVFVVSAYGVESAVLEAARQRGMEVVDATCPVVTRAHELAERLAEIGRQRGVATYHVETADEIQPWWFSADSTVGVMSGASTPDWIIEGVLLRLDEIRNELGG